MNHSSEEAKEDSTSASESIQVLVGQDGHNGSGANRAVLDAAKDSIHEAADEGRVETILRVQAGQVGVGDGLGYDGEAHGDPRHQVRHHVLSRVVGDVAEDGQPLEEHLLREQPSREVALGEDWSRRQHHPNVVWFSWFEVTETFI